MDAPQTLETLQKQRELVEHFIGLSQEHLQLWEDENRTGLEALFERRALLMSELTLMAETVALWIRKIHVNPFDPGATMEEMRQLNDEIVDIATHIIDIDEGLRQNFQGPPAGHAKRTLD